MVCVAPCTLPGNGAIVIIFIVIVFIVVRTRSIVVPLVLILMVVYVQSQCLGHDVIIERVFQRAGYLLARMGRV